MHIDVSAHDGVVTLNGHVRNFSQKFVAEKAVCRVNSGGRGDQGSSYPSRHRARRRRHRSGGVERLASDSSVPGDAVKVRVEKGWVTLSGKVDWHYQKEAAALGVGTLQGVIGVSNQILIKPAVDTRDVAAEITLALHRSWYYDANTIEVSAQGGKIKLTGNVTTWNARDLAGAAAWSAPGATSVENDIHVLS